MTEGVNVLKLSISLAQFNESSSLICDFIKKVYTLSFVIISIQA
jgi:hypothetical protein